MVLPCPALGMTLCSVLKGESWENHLIFFMSLWRIHSNSKWDNEWDVLPLLRILGVCKVSLVQRGQSQTFPGSDRDGRSDGPWAQTVQGGCGVAHLPWNHTITESVWLGKVSQVSSLWWNTPYPLSQQPQDRHWEGFRTSLKQPVNEGPVQRWMEMMGKLPLKQNRGRYYSNSCLTGKIATRASFLCCCDWGNKPVCTETSSTWEGLPDNMVKPQQFSPCFLWEVTGAVVVLLKALGWSVQEPWAQALEFHKQQGLFFNHSFYVWGNSTV